MTLQHPEDLQVVVVQDVSRCLEHSDRVLRLGLVGFRTRGPGEQVVDGRGWFEQTLSFARLSERRGGDGSALGWALCH
jgi:hypothetical protein